MTAGAQYGRGVSVLELRDDGLCGRFHLCEVTCTMIYHYTSRLLDCFDRVQNIRVHRDDLHARLAQLGACLVQTLGVLHDGFGGILNHERLITMFHGVERSRLDTKVVGEANDKHTRDMGSLQRSIERAHADCWVPERGPKPAIGFHPLVLTFVDERGQLVLVQLRDEFGSRCADHAVIGPEEAIRHHQQRTLPLSKADEDGTRRNVRRLCFCRIGRALDSVRRGKGLRARMIRGE